MVLTLIDLLEQDGYRVAKKTASEYSSPCPFCGGTDRFIIRINIDPCGRYWCRQCRKEGDRIQYLRDVRGLSYGEACGVVGKEPERGRSRRSGRGLHTRAGSGSKPELRDPDLPSAQWQETALILVEHAERNLWSDQGAEVRDFLTREKGLSEETIRGARLGWCEKEAKATPEKWGLEPETDSKGKVKGVGAPAGSLVIPLFMEDGQIARIRFRLQKPIRLRNGELLRYVMVRRSCGRLSMKCGGGSGAGMVVESELDALLIGQIAGDLVTALALGNAQTRPDQKTAELLRCSGVVLVSLDSDDPGAKEAWQYWARNFKNAYRWPCIQGKDPSDSWKAGVNIRAWVLAGLRSADKTSADSHDARPVEKVQGEGEAVHQVEEDQSAVKGEEVHGTEVHQVRAVEGAETQEVQGESAGGESGEVHHVEVVEAIPESVEVESEAMGEAAQGWGRVRFHWLPDIDRLPERVEDWPEVYRMQYDERVGILNTRGEMSEKEAKRWAVVLERTALLNAQRAYKVIAKEREERKAAI